MSNITSLDYIKGIKAKYEKEKSLKYSEYLLQPSPGLLNDLCQILKNNGLSKRDEAILERFYNMPNFDIDKFKPISHFFAGITTTPKRPILDVMALLVDFEPRPLGRFIDLKGEIPPDEHDPGQENGQAGNLSKRKPKKQDNLPIVHLPALSLKKIGLIIGLSVLSLLSVVFFYNYFSHKDCLQWNKDRYVEVDCNTSSIGFTNLSNQVSYNENLLQIRKITPTDTTTYFKNGKAVLWYCKDNNGGVELFNAPGHHPVSGKPLHCITDYMINKYLKK